MEPKTVIYELTDQEVMSLSGPIPLAIQIRIILNKAGFKFVDDNKPSSIINENPIPLGKMTKTYCSDKAVTIYKQTLI